MDYWNARKSITQKQIQPVYFFVGEEQYLADDLVRRILEIVVDPGTKDFNLDVCYASETDAESIINVASSYPMMAERRAVVVKELQKMSPAKLKLVAAYVQKPSETTCLILLSNALSKKTDAAKKIYKYAECVEVKTLYENQVSDWLRNYLKEKKLSMSVEASRLFQASVGTSLRSIVSEIDKIQLNIGSRTKIEEEDVAEAVGVSRSFTVFELCDAVGNRNSAYALKIVKHMMEAGESAIGIISLLGRHFRLLLKTKTLLSRGTAQSALSKTLRVNPFFVKNYIAQSKNFTFAQLRKSFKYLLEADVSLKSTSMKPQIVLEMLIINIIT